jgi:hypothetical protein
MGKLGPFLPHTYGFSDCFPAIEISQRRLTSSPTSSWHGHSEDRREGAPTSLHLVADLEFPPTDVGSLPTIIGRIHNKTSRTLHNE